MMNAYVDPMEEDAYADDYLDSSQQPTQSTQQASQQSQQSQDPAWDTHLWGFLQPCREGISRIDLWKMQPTVRIGRSSENDVPLANMKISNKHCTIFWDGKESDQAMVTVADFSSNGTFINGIRLGKGRSAILRDGNEIGFGSWGGQVNVHPGDDYRYIFRLTAQGPPREGLYAHYDIGHELGKGSFATVVSAISRDNGKKYAVKMINKARFRGHNKSEDQLKMFLREVSILEQLHHPNICDMKESFEDYNSIHLVLEFIDGGDLLEYIIKNGGLNEEVTRYLARQLCESLKYIHSKGIAHRDLKPENVLLTSDNPPVLKVADFGLAKAVDSMTKFKTTCGTPCYLAPEVILRSPEEEYSYLVDSWSVGVIVFSMLANASPFVEDETQNIAARFRSRWIDWEMLRQKNVSEIGIDFISRLLDNNPRTRMTCTEALSHPWLIHENSPVLPRGLEPMPSYESNLAEDGSIISILPGEQSEYPTGGQGSESTVRPQDGIVDDFEHIQMEDADEAAGSSQGGPSSSQNRALTRHPMEVGERDDAGLVQSFAIIPSVPVEAGPSTGNGDANNSRLRKRKDRSEANEDAFTAASDSSDLTPVSEGEGNAMESPQPHGRNLRARKKATPSPPSPQSRAPRGKTPAKRTRGARKNVGDNADVDM